MEAPCLPNTVEAVLVRLEDAGLRPYVVGGALRDLAFGRPARDFDLVVSDGLDRVAALLPGSVAIAAHTPVVAVPARAGHPRIEVTGFRGEARTLDQDLALRDFTLNAFAFDPRQRVFIDPLGGIADVAGRVLRATDPQRAFRDDPVRVLRGVRLVREFGLEPEDATEKAMRHDAWRLAAVAGERLRLELFRLLELADCDRGVRDLRRIGALAVVLPEVLRTCGVEQNRHHSDDVWTHTLRVCRLLPPRPLLRLAGLLHDVAKADTRAISARTGEATFHGHEIRADPHVAAAASRLRLSRRQREVLERVVRHHLLDPAGLQTDAAVRRMLRRVGRDILPDVIALRRADYRSRSPSERLPFEWEAAERRIDAIAQARPDAEDPRLAIGGRDVMRELGLSEGAEVGRWLERAMLRVLERPQENERDRLLSWLREAAREETE